MPRPTQRPKVHRYSLDFKLTAVKLSDLSGVQIKHVSEALDIHPFVLSRWRKQVRDGELRGRSKRIDVHSRQVTELRRLRKLEREHALLKEEHELAKKKRRGCVRS